MNTRNDTQKLSHPITKEVAIRDDMYNCRAVSDGNGGYYTYSLDTILAYGFIECNIHLEK